MKFIIWVLEGSYYIVVEGSCGEFGVFFESYGDKIFYCLYYCLMGLLLVLVVDIICWGVKIVDLIVIGGMLDYVVLDIDR